MASKRFPRLLKIITGTNSGEGEELLLLEGRLERSVHFLVMVWRHFVKNRCLIRASALAYTTILALIPLLAVVISISSGLLKNQDEGTFYRAIASIMPPANIPVSTLEVANHLSETTNTVSAAAVSTNATAMTGEEVPAETNEVETSTNAVEVSVNAQKELAHWLHHFVSNSQRQGALGVLGVSVFVFIAIMMLIRIEETFNDIWGVTHGRNWLTRVVLYWAAITLGPILILTAMSLSGSSYFQAVKDYFQQVPVLGKFVFAALPVVLLWLTFTFIYQIVPNTRVRFTAALTGGIVAGTAWHVNNVFGFLYVSRVIGYSKLYGSLGLIPVFMLGLYFSWAILLFGAQLAYAFQNRAAYLQDKLSDNVNQRGREFVALRIMTMLGRRFHNGMRPATVSQLSCELGVPSRLTQQVLRILGNANLVTEVGGAETAYAPARPLEAINAHDILVALRSGSGHDLPTGNSPELADIYGEFARIEAAERAAAEKISMLALVQRQPSAALAVPETPCDDKPAIVIPQIEEIRVPEIISVPDPKPETVAELVAGRKEEPVVVKEATEPPRVETPREVRRETVQPEERDFPL